jgi:FAD/FMN-containing dehydrogenase
MEKPELPDRSLVKARLRALLIDPQRFRDDPPALQTYLNPRGNLSPLLCAVWPRHEEDFPPILNLCRQQGLAIYSPIPEGLEPTRPGIVLDPARMDTVIEIDPNNLIATVTPGVTFQALGEKAAAQGLHALLPAASPSDRVVPTYLEREILLAAGRFTLKQVAIVHAYLADGRLLKSGSHALPNAHLAHREDGGPNLSKLLFQSKNQFGLPVKALVYLFPGFACRRVLAQGFKQRAPAAAFLKEISRHEVPTEAVLLDAARAESVLGCNGAAFTVAYAVEGGSELVDHFQKVAEGLAKKHQGKSAPAAAAAAAAAFARPWVTQGPQLAFSATCDRAEPLCALAEKSLKKEKLSGRLLMVPVKRATSVWIGYDLGADPADLKALEARDRAGRALLEQGAFFHNPAGRFAHEVLSRTGNYYAVLKKLKAQLDRAGTLNPDQLIRL